MEIPVPADRIVECENELAEVIVKTLKYGEYLYDDVLSALPEPDKMEEKHEDLRPPIPMGSFKKRKK
jgi:hypothetical protein